MQIFGVAQVENIIDDEKPRWQSNYFSGMPTPAAAIVVMLPIYLETSGLVEFRGVPVMLKAMLVYVLLIGILMVSTVPTYSGKLIEWEDAFNSQAQLMPEKVTWDMPPPVVPDADGNYPVAMPGRTPPA